jgi:hypothetical protein
MYVLDVTGGDTQTYILYQSIFYTFILNILTIFFVININNYGGDIFVANYVIFISKRDNE